MTVRTLLQWPLTLPAIYRITITVVFSMVVIALSVTPGIETQDDSIFNWVVLNTAPVVQNIMHIVVYALLMVLWTWSFPSLRRRAQIALALAITAGLGISLEWYQTTVPGRFGSLFDILLNLAGSLIGLIAALLIF